MRNAANSARYNRRSAEQSAADLAAGSRDGKRPQGVSSSERGPKRAKTKTAKAPGPFGGVNVVFGGDWWQLPPVLQTPLTAKPFTERVHQTRRMQAMFWSRDIDSVQHLFELNENKRNGEDAWLSDFLDECRAGNLSWDNYNFILGFPSKAPGTWLQSAKRLLLSLIHI